MSTIQTQINLVHLQSGVPVPSVTQRTSIGSQFAANVISVGTTDETIPLGDITTPKQVMVKLISGDRLMIGLDGATYPFGLVDADESMLLRLDVEGRVETTTVETVEDDADSLDGTYFVVQDSAGDTWALGVGTLTHSEDHAISTDLLTGQTAIQVAAALYAALIASSAFMLKFSVSDPDGTETFTITDKSTGTRADAADTGSTGFGWTLRKGAASPVIHLKSTGTSQVVVAVAPH